MNIRRVFDGRLWSRLPLIAISGTYQITNCDFFVTFILLVSVDYDNLPLFSHNYFLYNMLIVCYLWFCFKPIKFRCCPPIETSQLICCANQLTGFHMRAILALNGLNSSNIRSKTLRRSKFQSFSVFYSKTYMTALHLKIIFKFRNLKIWYANQDIYIKPRYALV